ncbi:MAG: phospholipase D-like domain-containing protein [Crocinitomicaceae bacterium]
MKEELINKIRASFEDNFLAKAEKKDLKSALTQLNPDKRIGDLLRSEVFKMAQEKINASNFNEVLKWVEDLNKVILATENDKSNSERIYFSPGEECLSGILSQIQGASQTIKICLFTISDDRIAEALISKHKQGVSVKIITDNDKIFDKGSDIDELASAGIPVVVDVTDNHMHHKFALFDNKTSLTGSYNWTRSAEKYNHENILITDSSVVYRAFNKEFDDLWDELAPYDKL